MGVRLLPPRLYMSEVASRESLRDTLLLLVLDTEEPKPPSAEPSPMPREPPELLKPNEELGGGAELCEKRELLWEVLGTEPEP